ncbi:MAG: hypothetical protein WAZ27_01790 [Minisyncoccia bacterium]
MGRITAIGELRLKLKMPVYKRQSGTIFMKLDRQWHVRVEQRGNKKAWTAIEDVVQFDPAEIVEVLDE